MVRKTAYVFLILGITIAAAVLLTGRAFAHGSMLNPISRVYNCYLENPETPDTLACRDAIAAGGTQALYDWNEVHILNAAGRHRELIPDGQLCSAGMAKYAAFDQPRLDWARTLLPASGTYTFQFAAYVPHNQGYFELYVTRNGYDPMQPLKWSDLEPTPFLRVEYPPVVDGNYVMTGALPSGKSGHHLIYAIWQRYDSTEAFYSCSDVWFAGAPTPVPTNPPACTAPAWNPSVVYQAGNEVTYNSRKWRARWGTSNQEPSTAGTSNGWEFLGFCSGSATQAATATPTNTPAGPTSTITQTPTRTSTPVGPTATPTRTATPGSGTCSVNYTRLNDWGVGATIHVVITNNGTSAIDGWTLAWSFPGNQAITNLWNGSFTQSAGSVSVTNLGYNAGIPANGGSTSLGFNLSYSGTNNNPANFTLNGVACQQ